MIEYLWAATVLTAATAVTALGLALLLARRLRELRQLLDAGGMPLGPDLPEPGRPVPEFSTTTTTGDRLTQADLDGPDVVVVFLMESCESCAALVASLRERPVPSLIAAVLGEGQKRDLLVRELEPVARVVDPADAESLAGDFGVHGFPAVLLAGGGVIRSASHRLSELPRALPT